MRIVYKRSCNERGNEMHSNLSMLMFPEKALLVKLYYQNGESTSAALRSPRNRKNIRTDKGPMIASTLKRMILKFEVMGCFDDRPGRG